MLPVNECLSSFKTVRLHRKLVTFKNNIKWKFHYIYYLERSESTQKIKEYQQIDHTINQRV